MLTNHCLKLIIDPLLSYLVAGEFEKDIIQTGTMEADTQYPGAKFSYEKRASEEDENDKS